MDAIWASAVAVAGTLLGSVITHFFQQRASGRSEAFARSEALRQERTHTYSAFAAAVEEYRRGQAERWYCRRESGGGPEFVRARDEAHRLRTAARQTCYRLQLVTGPGEVTDAALRAYDRTRDISTARTRQEHEALDAAARAAVEGFVERASSLVR